MIRYVINGIIKEYKLLGFYSRNRYLATFASQLKIFEKETIVDLIKLNIEKNKEHLKHRKLRSLDSIEENKEQIENLEQDVIEIVNDLYKLYSEAKNKEIAAEKKRKEDYIRKRKEDLNKEYVIINCEREKLPEMLDYWYSLGFRNDNLFIGNPSQQNQILALVNAHIKNCDLIYGYKEKKDDEIWF